MAIVTINTMRNNICKKIACQLDYKCRARKPGIELEENMLGPAYDKRRYHWPLG
jgi:hypothetical protein